MSGRRERPLALALCAAAAWALGFPAPSFAHLVTTGMGPVYDGAGHLLLTPEDLVPVVALALYAGLRGAAAGRRAMFLLPLAWLAGGLAGAHLPAEPSFPLPALSFVVVGGLVAADLSLSPRAFSALAIGLGTVHGLLNGVALRGGPGTLGLLGIVALLFLFVTLISAFVIRLRRPAARLAVRVAGSWIAATGLLLFGWALR